MRLDHLLSKEHLVSAGHRMVSGCWSRRPIRTERVRRVAHGWNIDSAVGSASSGPSTSPVLACQHGWWERVGGERVGWCTLLGPEGPGFLGGAALVVGTVVSAGGVVVAWGLGREGPSLGCMMSEGFLRGSVVPIVC